MKHLYKSLNLLFKDDRRTDEFISKILQNKRIPKKYQDFDVIDGQLVYVPLQLEVIKNADKQKFLKELFDQNINMCERIWI